MLHKDDWKMTKKISQLYIYSVLLLLPTVSFALGGETPVSNGLSYITDALTGATGIIIATLAIMGTALMCLFHKAEWMVFGYTVAAISIIFGSKPMVVSIVQLIKG
jgi:type IV secretory pathway VirB2 component (pilin)